MQKKIDKIPKVEKTCLWLAGANRHEHSSAKDVHIFPILNGPSTGLQRQLGVEHLPDVYIYYILYEICI